MSAESPGRATGSAAPDTPTASGAPTSVVAGAIAAVARRLFLALIRLYYPRRSIEGDERVPPAGEAAIYL
ncbi:MAG: hypothetical protein ABUS79_26700, partial [Pseudomonadota bacterium]